MSCQRCHGLLIPENSGELRDELGRTCLVTRCVNCGCIDDSVVRANRLRHLPKRSVAQGNGHNRRRGVSATSL
jgi:RNase P subunit RPR2